MSIKRKLIFLVTLALAAVLAISITSILNLNSLSDKLDGASEDYFQHYRGLSEANIDYHAFVAKKIQAKSSGAKVTHQNIINQIASALDVFESGTYPLETQQKAMDLNAKIRKLSASLANEENSDWLGLHTSVSRDFKSMFDIQLTAHNKMLNELSDNATSSIVQTGLVGLAAIMIITVIGVLVGRALLLPLREMRVAILYTTESLDFSNDIPVNSNDEVSGVIETYNLLLSKLRESFNDVQASTARLIEVAEEVDHASHKIARNSKMQSDASTNMAAAVVQLTNSISLMSEQSTAANSHTQNSREIADQSSDVILNTVTGIQNISESVREAGTRIKALRTDCESISAAANIIHDIAGQTNLLALNAAIEAARAGEQGRGFAVVADEVRQLAERTAKSTQEINALLKRMQDSSRLAVESMETTETAVSEGVVSAQQAGDSILAIRKGSNAAASEVEEISLAIQEQETASSTLSKHIDQIALMSEQNATSATNSADSIEQMSKITHAIATSLSGYKTSVNKAQNISLRVTDILGEDFPSVKALHVMANLLAKRSNGRITLKIFSGGDFGTEQETLEQTRSGVSDMARVNISQLNKMCPETVVPTLPFLFSSVDHMHRAMDGEAGRLVLDSVEKAGYIGLGLYDSGARSIYTKTPVRSVKDLRNLKFRVPPSDLWMAVAQTMGTIATPMSIDEIAQGIQMGLVDAAENNIFTYEGFEHYRSCPFFSKTEHVIAPDILVFSKKRWEQISAEDRVLIKECAMESVLASRTICSELEQKAISNVKRSGATIFEDVDKDSFKKVMLPVYSRFVSSVSQKEILKLIQKTK